MDFDKDIENHLTEYKKEILKITEEGVWKNNNKAYSHILPEERKNENLPR